MASKNINDTPVSATDTSVNDNDQTMTNGPLVDVQNLTNEERLLIRAYREADTSVQLTVTELLYPSPLANAKKGEAGPKEATEKVSGKRRHHFDEEVVTKRTRVQAGSEVPVSFRQMNWPKQQMCCLVQVDDGPVIGEFSTTFDGIGPKLFLDPGRFGSPQVRLYFHAPGTEGREVASASWTLDDHVQSNWVVKNFVAMPVGSAPPSDTSIYNPQVIRKCPATMVRYLCYMALDLRPYLCGYCHKNAWGEVSDQSHASALKVMFGGEDRDYQARIWFLCPRAVADFDRVCLAMFTGLFAQRQIPLGQATDQQGDRFVDTLMLPAPPTVASRAPRVNRYHSKADKAKSETHPNSTTVTQSAANVNLPAKKDEKSFRNRPVPSFGSLPFVPSTSMSARKVESNRAVPKHIVAKNPSASRGTVGTIPSATKGPEGPIPSPSELSAGTTSPPSVPRAETIPASSVAKVETIGTAPQAQTHTSTVSPSSIPITETMATTPSPLTAPELPKAGRLFSRPSEEESEKMSSRAFESVAKARFGNIEDSMLDDEPLSPLSSDDEDGD